MNSEQKTDLLQLLFALCDESLEAAEQTRLERMLCDYAEARQLYALYMGMVQRLDWDRMTLNGAGRANAHPASANMNGASNGHARLLAEGVIRDGAPNSRSLNGQNHAPGGDEHEPSAAISARNPSRSSGTPRWQLATVAVLVAGVIGFVFWIGSLTFPSQGITYEPAKVFIPSSATLTAAEECRWGGEHPAPAVGSRLPAGIFTLAQGVAVITFAHGAKMVVEGPAVFEVLEKQEAILHSGKLLAQVPKEARGFSLHTPRLTIDDPGHEWGVVCRPRGTEVFAFSGGGSVKPCWPGAHHRGQERLAQGETLRVTESQEHFTSLERTTAIDRTPFIRQLPPSGSKHARVAKMRDVVTAHPALLHHFTFEGDQLNREHLQDKKGTALLQEFRFGAGSPNRMRYRIGIDDSTVAFTPHRAGPTSGGAALETRESHGLPPRLTVECLVQPGGGFGAGYAICMRNGNAERGYFVRKSDRGPYLGTVIGSTLQEINSPSRFVPGHWYYIATTCEQQDDYTLVNFYLADVTAGEPTLTHVEEHPFTMPGSYPTKATLRIGSGEFSNRAPAFVFSGAIDEVAIYGDVLSMPELQQRLQLLVEEPPAGKNGPVLTKTVDDQ